MSSSSVRLAPFNPSAVEAIEIALRLLKPCAEDVVYDLGCGDGRFLVTVAEKTQARCVGVEYDEILYKRAVENVVSAGLDHLVTIHLADASTFDFSAATIIFLYLVPQGLRAILDRLRLAHENGARIATNIFSLPDWTPTQIESFKATKIYFYDTAGTGTGTDRGILNDPTAEMAEAEATRPEVELSSCVSFEKTDTELIYIGTSGNKIKRISGLEEMEALKELRLRSNLITEMHGIEQLQSLVHLELYDNRIHQISSWENLKLLQVLDLSYNQIREVPDLSCLPLIEEVYLASNKLSKIQGIATLSSLKKLDLGANRLREIEGLEQLVNLQELWLGKNKITSIGGLENLIQLKILSVQSNRLTEISGLDNNVQLEELYLSHNGIRAIAGVNNLVNLNTLDIGANQIQTIENLDALRILGDLWLNDNQIHDLACIDQLSVLQNLTTVYLERNPVAKDFEYRTLLQNALPGLTQIDAAPVLR